MVNEMMHLQAFHMSQVSVDLSFRHLAKIMDNVTGYSAAYFYDPDVKTHFLALGEAACCLLNGDERFQVAKQFLMQLRGRKVQGRGTQLRIFGGFSFVTARHGEKSPWKEWPHGKLFLPKILIECHEDTKSTRVTLCQMQNEPLQKLPDSQVSAEAFCEWVRQVCQFEKMGLKHSSSFAHKPHQDGKTKMHWTELVERGSKAVQAEDLKKVVLARRVLEPIEQAISGMIDYLNEQYPNNFTFAFWHMGSCFLGSSPERLASVSNGVLNVDCLAGSEARGKSQEEDDILGEKLLMSRKNRAEHQAVVDRVTEEVSHLVRDVKVAVRPVLKKLQNVQHLYTPVEGMVRQGVGILDVVESLHPTPAVAGVPAKEALSFIEENEEMDRGWYAGPIGYVDVDGNGTFAVGLRSGLVHGRFASLFAGAGIMADSDPETEWEETELKFMPMRSAVRNLSYARQSAGDEK